MDTYIIYISFHTENYVGDNKCGGENLEENGSKKEMFYL